MSQEDGTALINAAFNQNKDIVKLLLGRKDIDVNLKNKNGETALILAISNQNKDIVKLLLNRKDVDINAQDNFGRTGLTVAMFQQNEDIVKLLLNHKNIDVNLKGSDLNPLIMAIIHCNKDLVKLLLAHPSIDVNIYDHYKVTALMYAVASRDEDNFASLIQEKEKKSFYANIKKKQGTSALIQIVNTEVEDIVKLLLAQKNINVNMQDDKGKSVLGRAVIKNHTKLVQLLLKTPNINVNLKDNSNYVPLIYAVCLENKDIVELLLQHPNIDVNYLYEYDYDHSLFYSMIHDQNVIVNPLDDHPVNNFNLQDKIGISSLHYAISRGHKDIAKLLINHPNINVNSLGVSLRGLYGIPPLSMAIYEGYEDVAELLLQKENIDIHPTNILFFDPLVVASTYGYEKIVKLLLNRPEEDIIKNSDIYFQALLCAVDEGYENIINLLLRKGKNININREYRHTLLEYAIMLGRMDIVKLLIEYLYPNSIAPTEDTSQIFLEQDNKPQVIQSDSELRSEFLQAVIQDDIPKIKSLLQQKNSKGEIVIDDETIEDGLLKALKNENIKIILLLTSYVTENKKIIPEEIKSLSEEKIKEIFLKEISQGNIQNINLLLEQNNDQKEKLININTISSGLLKASDTGNQEVVSLLLSYIKDNINEKDSNGDNALIRASRNGFFDIVKLLLNHKANINSHNRIKRTSLMEASKNAYIRTVKILVKNKAKTSLKDKFNNTAFELVEKEINNIKNKSSDKTMMTKKKVYEEIKTILKSCNKSDQSEISQEMSLELPFFWTVITDDCEKDLEALRKDEPSIYSKIQRLIQKISMDPFKAGRGQLEKLDGQLSDFYSRRINKKHRLVYAVYGDKVFIKSCKGHYDHLNRKSTK
ncbi:ankyrin [Neocallimastix sp. 'constans']